MTTAGVGGPMTGRGADLMIIDDPLKNDQEANSKATRARLWDWYRSTVYTRLEPGGGLILVMTRWHEDDLAGRLLQAAEAGGERWEVVRLPALADSGDVLGRSEGEALWPDRYPLDALTQIRSTVGSFWWEALYQQQPTAPEGGIFKRSWFRYWSSAGDDYVLEVGEARTLHPSSRCWRFSTVDLAASTKTSADYTVVATWAVTPNKDLLLLDLARERMEGPDHVALLRRTYDHWKPRFLGVESVAYQMSLIQEANRAGLPVKALKPDRDKVSRALTAAARMEGGAVYFPKSAHWLNEWEAELLAFPNARHDDQVDVLAYAAIQIAENRFTPTAGWVQNFADLNASLRSNYGDAWRM